MSTNDGGYYPPLPPFPNDFHLLEVTIISAQDIFSCSRSMGTYAVAWVYREHRLQTRLDALGDTNPSWNDKFVFRIDDSTLRSETSTIQVDIYASRPHCFLRHDALLGTSRVFISTLRPSPSTSFFTLQIRRPSSLRPQGVLNIGVALNDAYDPSLSIYNDLGAPAFAYHDLTAQPAMKVNKASSLPQQQGEVVLDRNGSVGEMRENERLTLEKKLKKWRSEIPAMDIKEAEATYEEGSSKEKKKKAWGISCFSITGQHGDEIEEEDGSACPSIPRTVPFRRNSKPFKIQHKST